MADNGTSDMDEDWVGELNRLERERQVAIARGDTIRVYELAGEIEDLRRLAARATAQLLKEAMKQAKANDARQ